MSAGVHLTTAIAAEREAYRAMLAGEPAAALLTRSRDAYLASHGLTGPQSWGRLIGGLKMAILVEDGVKPIARAALKQTDAAGWSAARRSCHYIVVNAYRGCYCGRHERKAEDEAHKVQGLGGQEDRKDNQRDQFRADHQQKRKDPRTPAIIPFV